MKVDFLTRSLLYLPAHKEHLVENALKSGADMLALDLEDSCQPIENKQLGRDTILKFLKEGRLEGHKVFPRVNDRESGELLKDVYQLALPGISGLFILNAPTDKTSISLESFWRPLSMKSTFL